MKQKIKQTKTETLELSYVNKGQHFAFKSRITGVLGSPRFLLLLLLAAPFGGHDSGTSGWMGLGFIGVTVSS